MATILTTTRKRLLAPAIVLGLALASALPALADVKEGFRIHDGNHSGVSKSFGPIPGRNPYSVPVQQFTYENCRNGKDPAASQQYMQMVRFEVQNTRQTGHTTHLSLTWPNNDENFMGFILYDPEGNVLGNGDSDYPPEIHYTDLQNGEYFACATNLAGENRGFTLSASVTFDFTGIDPPSTPQPTAAAGDATPRPRTTPRPTAAATGSEPTPTPEVVGTPGPDGPLSQDDLPLVAAGRQGRPLEESNTVGVVFLALTIVIGLVAAGVIGHRIYRDRA